jgi:hypothetical protein
MTTGEGRDTSVGIATRYGMDGPRIEFRWGRDFSALVQTGPSFDVTTTVLSPAVTALTLRNTDNAMYTMSKHLSVRCSLVSESASPLLEGSKACPACPNQGDIKNNMSAECWCNDTDRTQTKYSENNLCQYNFTHRKSHMDWPEVEPRPPRSEAGN